MTASHIAEITDEMITGRLGQVVGCSVEWSGRMPGDAESWDDLADKKRQTITTADVRAQLTHDIHGDGPINEVDCAISMACEPDGLPDAAAVQLVFSD